MNNHIVKYGIIGVFNTIVGYSIIFLFMYIGVIPELSNALGYFFGIIISYYLNKYYTFKTKEKSKKELLQFILSMLIAYSINLFILFLSYRIMSLNPYISQILAGISYTITGYLLSKYWVFNKIKI